MKKDIHKFRERLLAWYDQNRRALPWRALPGETPDTYRVWLSEIMLQQTTVGAVIPYFLKFTKLWPNVHALAKAATDDVMREWAGLGYYARARNLHACAKIVSKELGGIVPSDQTELKKLPGIGDYTANAIAAIAFNKSAIVVDGNVERVVARYFAIKDPLPKSKPLLKVMAGRFFEDYEDRPGDLAQAFMDLGSSVCVPAAPRCPICPVRDKCQARIEDIAAQLPAKTKKSRPKKYGYVYWITNSRGDVLLHRRPAKGLLGGMAGLPTSDWLEDKKAIQSLDIIKGANPRNYNNASVRHVFTHFELELKLKTLRAPSLKSPGYFWTPRKNIAKAGLPTVFKKAMKLFAESI